MSILTPPTGRRKLRWAALAAFLLAALLASTLHFFLFYFLAAAQHGMGVGDMLISAAATVWTKPMVILGLVPLWILMLALGRVFALRFIKPRNAIWAYAACTAAVAILLAILLGLVFATIVVGIGPAFKAVVTNVLYPEWWAEILLRGAIGAIAATVHMYLIRWFKAEQPT